jgi:S-DNA-T family DNA segregation ATPase FtsK/SpoIIIE
MTGCGARIAAVPVGVADDGTPVVLDINEAARNGMGPHGLCVGATGSGKSEFLRTLALGMVTAHPPDVLNLILVDFKGGATFLGLERAPHVSAVITNLAKEAHLVSRMRDAIAGEMNRRQELLRAAGNFASVAEYEHARSQGAAMQPLPALFIMVDEFSELLSQHPDFADLFVAVGRLGRSLGIHLLLASQRLDEGRLRGLETHLSYRICLKTFSAVESRAVLGIPDAHHLPGTPGAAYLKTASGDLVRFQTAFVSGPFEPRGGSAGPVAPPITPVLFTAESVGSVRAEVDECAVGPAPTVLEAILKRLAGRGAPARRVWLPPLTASPRLGTLPAAGGCLTAAIGLVDNPYEQRRDPLVVDLSAAAGNVAVVGSPRSGKSATVRTLLLALAEKHDPTEVGFYCLDFGGGALSSLRQLPHIGAVASRLDVDLCRRAIAVVESVVRAREDRFRTLGIDSVSDYRRLREAGDPSVVDDPFGDVFLVVDGWATLRQDFESLERAITAIATQGLSFGVHVAVTASRWADLRPSLKDQIATRIELHLGDPAESEMDRRRARDLGDRPPGHGITANGREMVIALPPSDVADTIERLRARANGRRATPVELLPSLVQRRDVAHRIIGRVSNGVLIGMGERELEAVTLDFDQQQHLLVLGESGCGKTAVLRLLCTEIMNAGHADEAQLEIVDFRRTLLGVVDSGHLAAYTMSPASLASRLPKLLDELEARMPDENVTQHQLRTRSWWTGPQIYLVVDDYDLAAAVTGNPLARLADFLPHAQDLGLHVIVARRSGGAARAMFDPVLARMRDVGCMGLMMSASPDEGVLLGSVRPSSLPPGRGTLVTRDQADLIQVAWVDPP